MADLEFDCRFAYPSGFALNLQFCTEGITALVGPSGAGKTTVLNLIAGLLRPAEGRIALDGETWFNSTTGVNLPPEQRRVGYVFQDFMLFPHLTVLDNLRYGEQRGGAAGVAWQHVAEILEIEDLLKRAPRSLSGGQKQRVALGRAILRRPRLLLLDEPLNALDRHLQVEVAKYLGRIIAEFRLPTLLVSHDQSQVTALAQQTISIPN